MFNRKKIKRLEQTISDLRLINQQNEEYNNELLQRIEAQKQELLSWQQFAETHDNIVDQHKNKITLLERELEIAKECKIKMTENIIKPFIPPVRGKDGKFIKTKK